LGINKNKIVNGVVGSLMTTSKMLAKYSQEYLSLYSSQYIPGLLDNKYAVATNSYGVKKRNITMYSEEFRNGYSDKTNIFFNTGALLNLLLNYYYDTFFVNINPETSELSHSYLQLTDKSYFVS